MTHASLAKSRNRTSSVVQATTNMQISTGALATFGTLSTLVGLWAVACFVGAMLATGGPLALASAWISAVTGG
jgi:alkylated DNA nucleotide flippase Atl1